jgi:hypothetical protein
MPKSQGKSQRNPSAGMTRTTMNHREEHMFELIMVSVDSGKDDWCVPECGPFPWDRS